jgi:predicted O-methyltransferase YrrM
MTTQYLLDNAAEREASARMTALAAHHNDATFRYIEKCGIVPGWTCLEIGAGDGSVARWMAAKVGQAGRVLATDLDPRLMLKDPAVIGLIIACSPTREQLARMRRRAGGGPP